MDTQKSLRRSAIVIEILQETNSYRPAEGHLSQMIYDQGFAFSEIFDIDLLSEFLWQYFEFVSLRCRYWPDERPENWGEKVAESNCKIVIRYYSLRPRNSVDASPTETGEDVAESRILRCYEMPNEEFESVWENLYFDGDFKNKLLGLVHSILSFRLVDSNVIDLNRIILFYGPPGTGKTSIAKALGQKMSIQYLNELPSVKFIEVKAQLLFSKWFSESSQKVEMIFQRIDGLAERHAHDGFIIVLIDEIESLAYSRSTTGGGNDPIDSVRVVNTLLRELDHIKRHSNVIFFFTSNIPDVVDAAVLDRVDAKFSIGYPNARARYEILKSCITEFFCKGVIFPREIIQGPDTDEYSNSASLRLLEISRATGGISARRLRKIPFLSVSLCMPGVLRMTLDQFFDAVEEYLEAFGADRPHD